MSKKLIRKFNTRVNNLDNENGMEAAQVILILFLVVIGLIPIIVTIKNSLATKASLVNTEVITPRAG